MTYPNTMNAPFTAGRMPTYRRWNKFLLDCGVPQDDEDTEVLLLDNTNLSVGRRPGQGGATTRPRGHHITLYYTQQPLIEYILDNSTRFIITPPDEYDPDTITGIINTYTPDWFTALLVQNVWYADVTIQGVTRRYTMFYGGAPRSWRHNKLALKLRKPTPQAPPSADNPVAIDNSRDWTKLAKVPVERWRQEPQQYIDQVVYDLNRIQNELWPFMATLDKIRNSVLQVTMERTQAKDPSYTLPTAEPVYDDDDEPSQQQRQTDKAQHFALQYGTGVPSDQTEQRSVDVTTTLQEP